MLRDNKETLVLYLTDWQMRMVRDILKVDIDCHTLEIPIDKKPNLRYGIREPVKKGLKKMYLTEWQKNEMMDEAGTVCNFIELDPDLVRRFRYGMPED